MREQDSDCKFTPEVFFVGFVFDFSFVLLFLRIFCVFCCQHSPNILLPFVALHS